MGFHWPRFLAPVQGSGTRASVHAVLSQGGSARVPPRDGGREPLAPLHPSLHTHCTPKHPPPSIFSPHSPGPLWEEEWGLRPGSSAPRCSPIPGSGALSAGSPKSRKRGPPPRAGGPVGAGACPFGGCSPPSPLELQAEGRFAWLVPSLPAPLAEGCPVLPCPVCSRSLMC